jgi:hypothetical protein
VGGGLVYKEARDLEAEVSGRLWLCRRRTCPLQRPQDDGVVPAKSRPGRIRTQRYVADKSA